MVPRLIRLPFLPLLAALLLAVVGLQAALPGGGMLERTHGSAFSAATQDVALAAQRRIETVRHPGVPQPLVPPPAIRPATHPGFWVALARPVLRPDPAGPPRPQGLLLRSRPRAPPGA